MVLWQKTTPTTTTTKMKVSPWSKAVMNSCISVSGFAFSEGVNDWFSVGFMRCDHLKFMFLRLLLTYRVTT